LIDFACVGQMFGADSQTGVADEIASDVRTILAGLNSVVNGVGALRTHGGDAHGRSADIGGSTCAS
jgi:hypothetical protein